jgi:predicted metalloprotease with PDZ domain
VSVIVLRDGNEMNFDVVLGAMPKVFIKAPGHHRKFAIALEDRPYMGIDLMTLGDQLADFFQVDSGVLVKEVIEGSPAEEAGLQAGDVIVAYDGVDIRGSADLHEELSEGKPGDLVNLSLVRQSVDMDLAVTLAERDFEHNFNFRFEFKDPQIKVLWDKSAAELHEHMGQLHEHLQEMKDGQHEKLREHHDKLIQKFHYKKKEEN